MVIAHAPRTVWTRESYYRLADSNVLNGERVELVGGELIYRSPQKHPHAYVVGVLTGLLVGLYGKTHVVRVQLPLDLSNESQPEPDFAVVTKALHRTSRPHPATADLVIEVSYTSLAYDRDEKGALYATAGIPEYWIVNLVDGQIEVSRNPGPDSLAAFGARYQQRNTFQQGVLNARFAPEKFQFQTSYLNKTVTFLAGCFLIV